MVNNEDLIDAFLESQSRAVRRQLIVAGLLVLLGVALFFSADLLSGQREGVDSTRTALLSLGGGLVSTLSAFPIKDLIARREKADALRFLKLKLKVAHESDRTDSEEEARIGELLWKALNAIIEK